MLSMMNGTKTPAAAVLTGDLVEGGGLVHSTEPYLTTNDGYAVVDGNRISLNSKHQVFIYLDNVQGFSCYRPFLVYNGNTLKGLTEYVLQKMPALSVTEFACWDKAPGHYHRKRCGAVFSSEETEAHLLVKPVKKSHSHN